MKCFALRVNLLEPGTELTRQDRPTIWDGQWSIADNTGKYLNEMEFTHDVRLREWRRAVPVCAEGRPQS